MRHVNVTQTGFICPVETPEEKNVDCKSCY